MVNKAFQDAFDKVLPGTKELLRRSFSDELRLWCDMVDADAAHPRYTKELLTKAAHLIDMIDRECSLCLPHKTLPDRVQKLIHKFREEP